MVASPNSIPCGYYTCDIRYEFCSTGFVTPECLSCSGICSHYRVVNDPVATERCQSLCPVTSHIPTVEHLASVEDQYGTIVNLLIALIGLVVICLLAVVGLILLKLRRRSRRRKGTFSKGQHPILYTELSFADNLQDQWTPARDDPDSRNECAGASLLSESRPLANGYGHPRSSTTSDDSNTAGSYCQRPVYPCQSMNNHGLMVAGSGCSLPFCNLSVDNCTTNIGGAQARSSGDYKDAQTIPKDGTFHTALLEYILGEGQRYPNGKQLAVLFLPSMISGVVDRHHGPLSGYPDACLEDTHFEMLIQSITPWGNSLHVPSLL
ncbi:hypothetical protein LSH36_127g05034 [Paralvinella palmiformis]|uniref:Uncharacterized protein n=1 Tax=Paralvinella palmiformis TaxID=53620 RepID=A0AAD9JWQ7_9ANNE|nr:hypothetical protein LSH36_127g05034 [Paralvinella palmiformis]